MSMPRHIPPDAYLDHPVDTIEPVADNEDSPVAMAGYGMRRVKEWAVRGNVKGRALRHDLVTLSICPKMLPCKRPSASWVAREHGVSRQYASRLQQEFVREFSDYIQFRGQRFLNRGNAP
jgi:hypothetical protein